jgi:hypothetical protein
MWFWENRVLWSRDCHIPLLWQLHNWLHAVHPEADQLKILRKFQTASEHEAEKWLKTKLRIIYTTEKLRIGMDESQYLLRGEEDVYSSWIKMAVVPQSKWWKQNKGICSQLVELLSLISSKILILFLDCLPVCLLTNSFVCAKAV